MDKVVLCEWVEACCGCKSTDEFWFEAVGDEVLWCGVVKRCKSCFFFSCVVEPKGFFFASAFLDDVVECWFFLEGACCDE